MTNHPIPEGHFDRWADRKKQRLQQRHPLFADCLEEVTIVQSGARLELNWWRGQLMSLFADRITELRAAEFRKRVIQLVTPVDLAELERRLSKLPNNSAYRADFWRGQLRRLGAMLPVSTRECEE